MSEYLCITLLSRPEESEADFRSRLSAFWTHMLRQHKSVFEKVYAETVEFLKAGGGIRRKYLIEREGREALEQQLGQQQMDVEPIDGDDLYSKYEASPPEWFWIEH